MNSPAIGFGENYSLQVCNNLVTFLFRKGYAPPGVEYAADIESNQEQTGGGSEVMFISQRFSRDSVFS